MDEKKQQLLAEIRYIVRLCQRHARLYRRIQATGTFFAILGGSAAMTTLSNHLPTWLPLAGGALLAISGAALLAISPADKAALNEADMKRYQTLRAKAETLDAAAIAILLEEARTGDCPEIDALRNVAYNDVMREINREDQSIKLSPAEKFYDLLA